MRLSPQSVQWSGFTMRTILASGYEKAALSMEQGPTRVCPRLLDYTSQIEQPTGLAFQCLPPNHISFPSEAL